MKGAAWATWIARFDMEDLIGAILWRGTMLSVGLLLAGVILHWAGLGRDDRAYSIIQDANAFQLFMVHRYELGSPASWPGLLIDWGMATLFFTPYMRVVASGLYFACVHRSWKHTLLCGLALAPLTYILFLR